MRLERIAIVGAGAMGCSLAAITAPHVPTVLVVRRPERATRIRREGVRLEGALRREGKPEVVPHVDDLADIHPVDLVFIATKTTAIPEVCQALRPHRRELPFLVSYQNGIEPGRTLLRTLGTSRVLRMVLHYGAVLREHGSGPLRVQIPLNQPPHWIGGEGEEVQAVARALAVRLSAMGLETRFAEDIEVPVWRKGLMNAASNPVAALVRERLGELLRSPARPLIERLLDEGIAVARAAGIELGAGFRDEALASMAAGGTHRPSMAEDVLEGRTTEITQLNEQIVARAEALGVPTPTHRAVVELIRTFDWRAAGGGPRA